MHIVIDARVISSSTGTVVERLLDHLQNIDAINRYTVLLHPKDKDFWKPRVASFAIEFVDAPSHSVAEQITLLSALKRLRADLVYFYMPQQPLLYRGAKVTMFHDLTILRVRNPHRSALSSYAKRMIGWLSFKAITASSAHIITPSAYTKRDLAKSLSVAPGKISVVYEAADARPDATEPYETGFERFVMYVGRHSPYKNLKRLCDAHQQLLKDHPDLGLVLVGKVDADVEDTMTHCRERGYCNIVFTGFLDTARRDWLYANTAAYIFPSLAEGFGLPGLEAMGYGAPVVSSGTTCLPEIYGDAAAYFDPRDVQGMADAIEAVLVDQALRERLIRNGHERFAQFSWRRMAEETLAIMEDVATRRPNSAAV